MVGATQRRPASHTSVDATPAGRVARQAGPWVVDAALAVGGLSGPATQIFSALRARGQNSGWAVLGDALISRICGYQPGSDAARRQRRRLVESGWAVLLDAGGGCAAAAYCPSVPTQAILDALDCGLLHTPRHQVGGPDVPEGVTPDSPGSTPPDITVGVNRNLNFHSKSSSSSRDDHNSPKAEERTEHMIDRVAARLSAGRIDDLSRYLAASALREELPSDRQSLEHYESLVRSRLEKTARERAVASEKRQIDSDRRMKAQLEASEKQRLADIRALSKNTRN